MRVRMPSTLPETEKQGHRECVTLLVSWMPKSCEMLVEKKENVLVPSPLPRPVSAYRRDSRGGGGLAEVHHFRCQLPGGPPGSHGGPQGIRSHHWGASRREIRLLVGQQQTAPGDLRGKGQDVQLPGPGWGRTPAPTVEPPSLHHLGPRGGLWQQEPI